jgi:thiol-disulfide isomerase/thioredoxin
MIGGSSLAAHWCPPCRGFTPKLADYYRKVTGDDKNLEIVYVSFDRSVDTLRLDSVPCSCVISGVWVDRDERSFNEYFHDMPWVSR